MGGVRDVECLNMMFFIIIWDTQVQTDGLTGHIEFTQGSRSNFTIDVMETSMAGGVKQVGFKVNSLSLKMV